MACSLIASLNALASTSPLSFHFASSSPHSFDNNNNNNQQPQHDQDASTASQHRLVQNACLLARDFVFARRQAFAESDDDTEHLDDVLRALLPYSPRSGPKRPSLELQADKVSLPANAATAELLDLLPPGRRGEYQDFNAALFKPKSKRGKPVKGRLHASKTEYAALVKRLLAAGMVDVSKDKPAVVNGVFAVAKDGDAQRLIIDARPANRLFKRPDKVSLPSPENLARLVAPAEGFFVAKSDVDSYYHRLRLPKWLCTYFGLPALSAKELGLEDELGDVVLYPRCLTLPMGWSHSVLLAQEAHLNVLAQLPEFAQAMEIKGDSRGTLDKPRYALYIDDLILVGKDAEQLRRMLDAYITKMELVGLSVKKSKVVLPTRDAVRCLGFEVCGSARTVRVDPIKLEKLVNKTRALLEGRFATGEDIEELMGYWSWFCLVNRPLLSVFCATYRFARVARGKNFVIWRSVRKELEIICGLAPCFVARLDLPGLDNVWATDASSGGFGVVKCSAPADVVAEAFSTPAACNDKTLALKLVATQPRWTLVFKGRWRRDKEHIDILEAKTVLMAVKRLLTSPGTTSTRVLLLCDNTAVVGALMKGRSSSFKLLSVIRRCSAHFLAATLKFTIRWIPSDDNPADRPSRE